MRLALFGGTFDPIHLGHVAAALAAADEHALDRVLVVPSGNPPHKKEACRASYEHRLRMVELACAADPRLEPSRLEEPGPDSDPHYTVDTLARVTAEYEFEAPLRCIVGADAFAEFDSWRGAATIAEAVEFLVVGRDGFSAPAGTAAGAHAKPVTCDSPAASHVVRHRAKIGGSLADLVSPAVCAYIWEHGLYQL